MEGLPDYYRTDEPFIKDALDKLEGHGHRRGAAVNCADGLSDDR